MEGNSIYDIDKINKYALFIKLMNRKCPIGFIDLLYNWYNKSVTCVRWGNVLSRYVQLSAGIRQGGIMSLILFAVYINDVLVKLQKSGLGCVIKNVAFNAFMYADDLLLLSISVCDMQRMIDLCKTELDWFDLRINSDKTSFMRIGNRYNCRTADILIDGNAIVCSQEIKYLGVFLLSSKVFKCDPHYAKTKYFRSLNGFLSKIGSTTSIDVSLSLSRLLIY